MSGARTGAPRIVVIGGGVAGLATAGLLARGGAQVTLLERNATLGGRSGRLTVAGHTFDTGPSWYLMPEAFEQWFALMGRRVEDHLDLIDLDPRYRVFFEGEDPWGAAESLDVSADPESNWETFEELSPGDGAAMRRYAEDAGELYRIALDRFLYTTFARPLGVVDRDVLRRLPRLASLLTRSLGARIAAKVRDPRLRQILGFHAVFLGSSPSRAPSLFSLMSHLDLTDGVRYPRGGMYAVIEALAAIAREEGAAVRTSSPVARIVVDDAGFASGVELASGELVPADAVVSAADLHHTETALVPEEWRTHPERSWRRREPGVSALLAMVEVDGKVDELAHHSLFFTGDWDANFEAILGRRLPPVPASVYVSRVGATDPSVSAEGKDSLFLLVPFPADPSLGSTAESRAELMGVARRYLAQIGAWAGIEDLPGRSTVLKVTTPADFAEGLGAWQGGALGLEHTLLQSAMFRPANVSSKVANLLYAGASTVPGIGVPLCLISAELVAKRLLGAVDVGPLPTPAPEGFLSLSKDQGVLGNLARRAGSCQLREARGE
ncbi:phytoene desaturase family protein [Demequina sp. SYSU T00039]|uniref:Phytoene desaturase family protein n=1 Tax=Demequina lignilytica TaxID=3051663 RepID=A0AAW7M940_9MICO|nr:MULTISPECIES: phytoene desaturase family protein [unclassified Demequina]MDN4477778.1 phytoene desaturase family protein [Demequina sp. SYSU T00039-1]MDN4487687.1 phytoene desaturase family protein [Demequina sp. SYSU T00039]MDN4491398.1 phytoene desaturase family protein [Demequina sp. SYSU T00068]